MSTNSRISADPATRTAIDLVGSGRRGRCAVWTFITPITDPHTGTVESTEHRALLGRMTCVSAASNNVSMRPHVSASRNARANNIMGGRQDVGRRISRCSPVARRHGQPAISGALQLQWRRYGSLYLPACVRAYIRTYVHTYTPTHISPHAVPAVSVYETGWPRPRCVRWAQWDDIVTRRAAYACSSARHLAMLSILEHARPTQGPHQTCR